MFSCKGIHAIYSVFRLFLSIFGIRIVNKFTNIIFSDQNKMVFTASFRHFDFRRAVFELSPIYVMSVLARSLFKGTLRSSYEEDFDRWDLLKPSRVQWEKLLHSWECNGTYSIALLRNRTFYSILCDHKQPIKRPE